MRFLAVIALVCSFALTEAKCEESDEVIYYTLEDWTSWLDGLRGCDDLRMTLASTAVDYPTSLGKDGKIKFEKRFLLDTLLYDLKDLKGSNELLALLEFQPRVEKSWHGCYGLFNLYFYRKGERVGRLHYAHGRYWAPLTANSAKALNRWLAEHGFPIEETMNKDRSEANHSTEPAHGAVH